MYIQVCTDNTNRGDHIWLLRTRHQSLMREFRFHSLILAQMDTIILTLPKGTCYRYWCRVLCGSHLVSQSLDRKTSMNKFFYTTTNRKTIASENWYQSSCALQDKHFWKLQRNFGWIGTFLNFRWFCSISIFTLYLHFESKLAQILE